MTATIGELAELAVRVRKRATALGADEASVSVSRSVHASVRTRDGRVEQSTGATTRGLSLSVLVQDRFTSNSTNDLRPEALETFVERSVAAARWLEVDPHRRLPDGVEVGRGASEVELDSDDASWAAVTPADREAGAQAITRAIEERAGLDRVSIVARVADGRSESFRTATNGFEDGSSGTSFGVSGQLVLADGDKRLPGGSDYGARHRGDLPGPERLADESVERARQSLGARTLPSGRYPLLLDNRVAGAILGMLSSAISGSALHDRRSFLLGRLGERVASPLLDIVDDPTLPRAPGSRPWDGEGRVAKVFPVLRDGVLQSWYLSTWHARKLGLPATTGGRSNWVLRPGTRPFAAIARDWPRAIQITSFLGGSSNTATGDFSYGIRGLLLERGEVAGHLAEMNVTGNLGTLLNEVAEVGNDPWPWSSVRTPCLVWPDVQFSGS